MGWVLFAAIFWDSVRAVRSNKIAATAHFATVF